MVRKAVEGGGQIAVGLVLWGHPWSGDGDFPHLSRGWTTWLKRGVPRNELIRLIRGLSNRDISIRFAISRVVAILFATIITLDDFCIRCWRVGIISGMFFFLRFEWWRRVKLTVMIVKGWDDCAFPVSGLVCERLRWFRWLWNDRCVMKRGIFYRRWILQEQCWKWQL